MQPQQPEPFDQSVTQPLPTVSASWGPALQAPQGPVPAPIPVQHVLLGDDAVFVNQLAYQLGLPPEVVAQQLAQQAIVQYQPTPAQWAAYHQYAQQQGVNPVVVPQQAIAAARQQYLDQYAAAAATPVRRALFAPRLSDEQRVGCRTTGIIALAILAVPFLCCVLMEFEIAASAVLSSLK